MSGIINIPILEISQEEFRKVMTERREPLVLRGSDLGSCTRTWSPEKLSERLNPRQVRVHVGQEQDLDFRTKNFKYCDIDIKELVKRAQNKTNEEFFIDKSEIYYLRQGLIQLELITNHFLSLVSEKTAYNEWTLDLEVSAETQEIYKFQT